MRIKKRDASGAVFRAVADDDTGGGGGGGAGGGGAGGGGGEGGTPAVGGVGDAGLSVEPEHAVAHRAVAVAAINTLEMLPFIISLALMDCPAPARHPLAKIIESESPSLEDPSIENDNDAIAFRNL